MAVLRCAASAPTSSAAWHAAVRLREPGNDGGGFQAALRSPTERKSRMTSCPCSRSSPCARATMFSCCARPLRSPMTWLEHWAMAQQASAWIPAQLSRISSQDRIADSGSRIAETVGLDLRGRLGRGSQGAQQQPVPLDAVERGLEILHENARAAVEHYHYAADDSRTEVLWRVRVPNYGEHTGRGAGRDRLPERANPEAPDVGSQLEVAFPQCARSANAFGTG